jgi:hypothetical protein
MLDSTPIVSKKYPTIGELKRAPDRSVKIIIANMKEGLEREYLSKWAFDKYYVKQLHGNLTLRLKSLTGKIPYYHIVNHCLDGIDPLKTSKTYSILNKECMCSIESLYNINPSLTGIFIDYLVRRIICELRGEDFIDNRSNRCTNLENIIETDNPLWQFNNVCNTIGRWIIFENPEMDSKKIDMLELGDVFMELDRKDEWLKISYKETIGYVRYLIPNTELTLGVTGDIKDYVPNKWFSKIENSKHYCKNTGCKMGMEQTIWIGDIEPNECTFPICQNHCYMKVKDTNTYPTRDILIELFITSLCHTEAFGNSPKQEMLDNILKVLNELDMDVFMDPLIRLCKTLLLNSSNVLLNPGLGEPKYGIPADCDLVMDDILMDIKCTKKDNTEYEMLQLLGYSSLLLYNDKYKLRMKNICILNLLEGVCKIYNIENILDDNLLDYLDILSNKYNSEKPILKRECVLENVNYPAFIRQLNPKCDVDILQENIKKLQDKIEKNNGIYNIAYGSFVFKYRIKVDSIHLEEYGIFNKSHHLDKIQHSFILALKHSKCVTDFTIEKLEKSIMKYNLPKKVLKQIAEKNGLNVSLKIPGQTHNTYRYGNKDFPEIKLALIENHYILIEKTKYTTYGIKNYKELVKTNPKDWYLFTRKGKKQKGRGMDSYNLIKFLVENKDTFLDPI